MDNLYIAATATSPEVDFRFDQHSLLLRGESYPENAAAFYAPIIEQLRTYLAGCVDTVITIDVVLTYFNSSSTKMLFSMFDALDDAAQSGCRVLMNWYRDERDSTSWHADRPAHRAPTAIVPVLSLGAPRRFLVRPTGGGPSTVFTPAGGDLIIMQGRCQRDWQHCVPKQKAPAGARMSLNFSSDTQS